jgi:hypothetical protein
MSQSQSPHPPDPRMTSAGRSPGQVSQAPPTDLPRPTPARARGGSLLKILLIVVLILVGLAALAAGLCFVALRGL